jgi:murein DD-endopeptidase MepM/ murein hydrolase activator NlpD
MHWNHLAVAACIAACLGPSVACNYSAVTAVPPATGTVVPSAATFLPGATGTLPPPSPSPNSTPAPAPQPFPTTDSPGTTFSYTTRAGDTLLALARRFEVEPSQIVSDSPLSTSGYLLVGQALQIPNLLEVMSPGGDVLPDAELVYSPTAADFDIESFVASANGYLSHFHETMADSTELSGAAIVQRVADENSINPRLLLALLEFHSGWVYGAPANTDAERYPIGFRIPDRTGLYQELSVAATQLSRGYYGWRLGTIVETRPDDGGTIRWNPTLNAGSVAVLHLYALLSGTDRWMSRVAGPQGFAARYQAMFGDAWARAKALGPILPPDLEQPALELPFAPGERWSLTAGPHYAWSSGTPRAALDFSPITDEEPCAVSARWVTASAPGFVVRAVDNAVVLDLDRDGREATGWVLVYYHLADKGLIAEGTLVAEGDALGHPSCEGGRSTGKHVHVARKYNGEWLPADGPVPFVLSGWRAVADERNYYGSLVRGAEQVTSDSSGQQGSTIWR